MSHHYEIEYSLIGSLLKGGLTPQARDVMTWLEPEMFATFQLGATYANIRKQSRKDNLIDLVLLNQDFGEDLSMLAEISKNTFSASNLSGYAEKVRNNWIIRTAQKTLLETANKFSVAKDNELESIVPFSRELPFLPAPFVLIAFVHLANAYRLVPQLTLLLLAFVLLLPRLNLPVLVYRLQLLLRLR